MPDHQTAPLDPFIQTAADSAIARHPWADRGVAPFGYIKGMALVFARAYCRLQQGDAYAVGMAKPDTGNSSKDALSHYLIRFRQLGMDNAVSGADTLRHLFVLLLGLGMREGSGRW